MSSFACENIHEGQERINTVAHKGHIDFFVASY